jgi:hypothetical protein
LSDEWYYTDQNGQLGPLTFQDLKARIDRLSSLKSSFVWRADFEDWRKAEDLPELRTGGRKPPPPPPNSKSSNGRADHQDDALLSKAHMIVISGATSLMCVLVLFIARAGESFLSARNLGGVLGAGVGLFALSWTAAGTLYLLTFLKMSRDQLTFSALVAQVIVAYFAYVGLGM